MGLVLDVSNYDRPTFNAECLRGAGVERVIIGCWDIEATRWMLREARRVGIKAEDLYAFLYFGWPHERREVEHALRLAREEGGIKRVWLDVEARPPHETWNMNPFERARIVRECVQQVREAGLQPGIYTGRWYWVPYMGNTTEFASLPLWHSYYGRNDGTQPPIREVDFGGWKTAAAHQYTSNLEVCGRRRDANYWWVEEEGDDAMADAQDVLRELRSNKALRDAFVAMLVEEGPIHLEMDAQKRQAWAKAVLSDVSMKTFGTPDMERGLKALTWRATASEIIAEIVGELGKLKESFEKLQRRLDRNVSPPPL